MLGTLPEIMPFEPDVKKSAIGTRKDVIAVDLDGTLAYYDHWRGETHIGKPIDGMLRRVKQWLANGKDVVIFTARMHDRPHSKHIIQQWLLDNGLPALEITNEKRPEMIQIWDDRAIHVGYNTGEPCCDGGSHGM